MDAQNSPPDVRIAELAARQHGVVAWWQLIALGLSRGAIARRLATGRLHRLHEGVYAVGHVCVGRNGRLMAAALAFGPGAVLSHRTAAEVHGILPASGGVAHVSSDVRSLVGRPGIVLHRCRSLAPELRTAVDGIPVTTIPRVLLDLASYRNPTLLRRAWQGADRGRLLDVRAVVELCDNSPGRRTKPLRALIEAASDAPDTREELEHRFADLIEAYGLPRPVFNAAVGVYVVDALWVNERLVVELDSRAFHDDGATFESDRVRDVELMLAGYRVYRVTWRELTANPARVAARIRALLDPQAVA